MHTIEEGYLQAIGVPLVRGRALAARDDVDRPSVVLVNETFVERFFPNRDPIGARIVSNIRSIGPLGSRISEGAVHEIVGVVADVKNTSLRSDPEPAVYFPLRQFPFRKMYYALVGPASTGAMLDAFREEVGRIDAGIPLGSIQTMDRVLAKSTDPPRFVMLILTMFAALALSLAALGVYGVLSYLVSQRRREIGIRLALGARPADVLRSVVAEGMIFGGTGALLGVAAAALAARALGSLLYDVRPADPATLTIAFAIVLAVTLFACLLPGQRAATTEPVRSLRH